LKKNGKQYVFTEIEISILKNSTFLRVCERRKFKAGRFCCRTWQQQKQQQQQQFKQTLALNW
jgi:hypothetical protein